MKALPLSRMTVCLLRPFAVTAQLAKLVWWSGSVHVSRACRGGGRRTWATMLCSVSRSGAVFGSRPLSSMNLTWRNRASGCIRSSVSRQWLLACRVGGNGACVTDHVDLIRGARLAEHLDHVPLKQEALMRIHHPDETHGDTSDAGTWFLICSAETLHEPTYFIVRARASGTRYPFVRVHLRDAADHGSQLPQVPGASHLDQAVTQADHRGRHVRLLPPESREAGHLRGESFRCREGLGCCSRSGRRRGRHNPDLCQRQAATAAR